MIAHVIDGEAKGGDFSREFCTRYGLPPGSQVPGSFIAVRRRLGLDPAEVTSSP